MSYQGLAQPAPTVEYAEAQAPIASNAAVVVTAAENLEEVAPDAAPVVGDAVTGDYQKFAPTISPTRASKLSVQELRKGGGTDFESEAGVIKGGVQKDCLKRCLPFLFDERDFVSYGEVRRYLFIKGNCLFVYGERSDPSPLYVIELPKFTVDLEDPKKPDPKSHTISPQAGTNLPASYYTTVLLREKNKGKRFYQITFDDRNDKSLTKRFLDVFRVNADHYGGAAGEFASASVVIDDKKGKKY